MGQDERVLFGSVGRRGNYGVDTPIVPAGQAFIALVMLQLGYTTISSEDDPQGWWLIVSGGLLLGIALIYLHASRRGKFRVWSAALGQLGLDGDERVLDLGCGRGAVTTLVAARLTTGSVLGVDSWTKRSMLVSNRGGTEEQIAARNSVAEGVEEHVKYQQADITALNLTGNQFDLVVSGLSISALPGHEERRSAVDEAVRVARPGGRVLIADIRHTERYAERLRELGCEEVTTRSVGWEAWYGGPWTPTILVSARKATY